MPRPRLSAVLIAASTAPPPVHVLELLRRQTVAAEIEVVVAGDARLEAEPPAELAAVRHVDAGGAATVGELLTAGFAAARAEWVVYVEEHVFFGERWAETLLAATGGTVAVGTGYANANPATASSWSALLTGFTGYAIPVEGGETGDLPWHGTAYRRAALPGFGDRLPALLECPGVLHHALVARGQRLVLEPAAVTAHVNVSGLHAMMASEALTGCALSGGTRPLRRRLLLAFGSPLIALRRLRGFAAAHRRVGAAADLPRGTFALGVVGLLAFVAGMLAGAVVPGERAARRRLALEIDRASYVVAGDRERLRTATAELRRARAA